MNKKSVRSKSSARSADKQSNWSINKPFTSSYNESLSSSPSPNARTLFASSSSMFSFVLVLVFILVVVSIFYFSNSTQNGSAPAGVQLSPGIEKNAGFNFVYLYGGIILIILIAIAFIVFRYNKISK